MTPEQRILHLEQALDECIKRYDLCLRFKGTYLCERQGDFDAIDRFRRVLNTDRALPLVRSGSQEAHD